MNQVYPEEYLEGIISITELLFYKFTLLTEYDYFSCVTEYMLNSDIRKRMDQGNTSALNKGIKQLLNSVDLTKCEKNE